MTQNTPTQPPPAGADPARPAAVQPEAPRRRWALLIAGVILLSALSAWLMRYWTHGRFIESTNDAYLQADQVNVASRVAGFVEEVYVRDNEAVIIGQPLAKLDERDPRARLEQALAQAQQANAAIAQVRAQIGQQHAQIAELRAQLEVSRTQSRFADKQVERYTGLVKAGAETDERYDQLRQSRDQSHAQIQKDAAAVLAAERTIETYTARIQEAQAQIEQAQAQARRAQVDLDATLLRASINGRVGDKTVRIGEYIQPGDRLMTLVPVHDVYLVANFKETQIGHMRIGQPASIAVDALDGHEIHGSVESFSPGTGAQFALIPPNNATGNFTKIVQRVPVRIRLHTPDNLRGLLVPGLSVTVDIDTGGGSQ